MEWGRSSLPAAFETRAPLQTKVYFDSQAAPFVRELFARLGHELVGALGDADLAWTTLRQPAFYKTQLNGAVSSQLPGALFLDRKDFLAGLLKGSDVLPETLELGPETDDAQVEEFLQNERAFCKSATGARGAGVRLVSDPEEVRGLRRENPNEHFVLQREVAPRTWAGRKFDLRVYVLAAQGLDFGVGNSKP